MRSDSDIRRDVEAELKWSPDVNETDIAFKVNDGVVALSGFATSFPEKYRAEAAVKRVSGVAGVANDIVVRAPQSGMPADPEIARAVVTALEMELPSCWEGITPTVIAGHVELEGTVEWHHERDRAEAAARRVHGVLAVRNSIKIKPRLAPTEIKHQIEEAFRRNAIIDAQKVIVETRGDEVILRGQVRSWAEHDQAQLAAWSAPGVTRVRNELTIRT
jgi:osmotically-inducible protein OsmY